MNTAVPQATRRFAYRVFWMLCVMMGVTTASMASAATVMSNDFENYSLGLLPIGGDWDYVNDAFVTNHVAPHSSQSLFLNGNPGVTNAQANARFLRSYSQLWLQADVHIHTPSNTVMCGAVLQLLAPGGWIPADLRLIPNSSGTYDVKVLTGPGVSYSAVYTNLPVETAGTFRTFTFGVIITNAATGDGRYSLYLNSKPLATNVPYSAFSSTNVPYMDHMGLFGDAQWDVYRVRVFDANPVP